jgi:hypothetical protein
MTVKRSALACLYLLVGFLAVSLLAPPAQAQNNAPLQLGTWSTPVQLQDQTCTTDGLPHPCYSTTISCQYAEPLVATYAVTKPTQPTPNGTIVLFSGLGGTSPSTDTGQEDAFSLYYTRRGYEVVQFFWALDWEDTTNVNGPTQRAPRWDIQTAACRPATFLNYAFTNLAYEPNTTGFCAQGTSGGAGAVAYSMARYGAGQTGYTPLDKVELPVGPPFGDIEQGCEEPEAGDVQIGCPSNSPSWCAGWDAYPQVQPFSQAYDQSSTSELVKWTGDNTCQNPNLPNDSTSPTSNGNWYNQSIVENATGTGTFTYPNTDMQAWLCASVSGTGSVKQNTAQGWLFYQRIILSGTPLPMNYHVAAVQTCNGAEGYETGTVGGGPYVGQMGMTAVETDMAGPLSQTQQCTKNSGR